MGVTQFSVRRYPLDKSRYEVMLELTNTGTQAEDVELQLLGDGALADLTKLRLNPGERLPRFYPQLSGASRTLEAKIALVDGSHDDLPADDHAYALLPERHRAKVLVVTAGNTYLEAALLLDEYLDVTDVAPKAYPEALAKGGWDAILFDEATPAEMPKANALYLDPRGPGSPVKVTDELKNPGFDKIDRKHPTVRFLALDDVNVSLGHKLVPESGDKVIGASDGGSSPLLVAGTRGGNKFVALGFDVRDSDLPLRTAWPLFVIDCVNWFIDEDAQYLSSFRTGEVWRIPLAGAVAQATLKRPDGTTRGWCRCTRGGRSCSGSRRGSTSSAQAKPPRRAPGRRWRSRRTCSDASESAIAPQEQAGRGADRVGRGSGLPRRRPA